MCENLFKFSAPAPNYLPSNSKYFSTALNRPLYEYIRVLMAGYSIALEITILK